MSIKNKIILAQTLAIIVMAYFLFQSPEIKTEIKTIEKIVKVVDTVYFSKPQKVKRVFVNLPEKSTPKETKEFIYVDTLKNGIVSSSIFSDTIYKRKVELVTFNKETTIEKSVFKPVFYVAPSVSMHGLKEVKNASLNGFVANKKLLFGAGAGLDIETGTPTVNATIGFKF